VRKKFQELSVYLLPFVAGVLIYSLITNYQETRAMFSGIVGGAMSLLSHFFMGFVLAYILDFLVSFLHRRFKVRRWLGIALAYVILFALLASFLFFIVPLIIESVQVIVSVSQSAYVYLSEFLLDYADRADPELLMYIEDAIKAVMDGIFDYIKGLLTYDTVTSILAVGTNTIVGILIGLITSLFLLIEKDAVLRQARRLVYAAFKPGHTERVLELAHDTNKIFSGFMLGKLIDSLVVFVMSLVPYLIFGLPLAPFLAVIASVTNLIPYFGPVVGTAITCFILLCFDPVYVIYALGVILAVQIIEGYIIAPKILGDSVGISPLLTIIAITIGGAVAGFIGMLIGVPIVAVLKLCIYDRYIAASLRRRRESALTHSPDTPLPPELEDIEDTPRPKPGRKKREKRGRR
jgi:predicted PurR-regulated permease PerM